MRYSGVERVARINADRNVQSNKLGLSFKIERNRMLKRLNAVWKSHWDLYRISEEIRLLSPTLVLFAIRLQHWSSNPSMPQAPEGLSEHPSWGPTARVPESDSLECGPGVCVSGGFPGDADDAG